jgi:hypothetical protein
MKTLDQTFQRFQQDLEAIFGSGLRDIIIHGSCALGDFRPHKGDIDYIVMTANNLDERTINRLFTIHDSYRYMHELLLDQLEGTFYPEEYISTITGDFSGAYIGTGRSGWRQISTLENSLIDLRVASSRGISLLARPITIYNPSDNQIRVELSSTLRNLNDRLNGKNIEPFGNIMSIVHWSTRALCFLETGGIVSKGEGCRWARTRLDPQIYNDILMMAENERFPYNTEKMEKWMPKTCASLLQMIAIHL